MSAARTALFAAPVFLAACASLSGGGPTEYSARDYGLLSLGGTVDGPVGPAVEASWVWQGDSLGDLTGRVDCPAGTDPCDPRTEGEATVYTYVYRVTPGNDAINDDPFPRPEIVRRFDDVTVFATSFAPPGFTGIAGYSFGEAEAALGAGGGFRIERRPDDGGLTFRAEGGSEPWGTGETITFFYQSTQPPKGPAGGFLLEGGGYKASGVGPVPMD